MALSYLSPSSYIKYNIKTDEPNQDAPIRAQSVCLKERPRSQYGRSVQSADLNKQKHYQARPQTTVDQKRRVSYRRPSFAPVKQQNRKPPAVKQPCAVSVQTLSIPMKYADDSNKHKYSTSNRLHVYDNKTKCTLPKQVSEKKLCEDGHRKETENKLLLQISEAEQVADFERILNSNAILSERARGHVWRRNTYIPSTADARPRSAYSLHAISETYHYLYRQHQESLQPLIDNYRQGNLLGPDQIAAGRAVPHSILGRNWYEELQDLSEFYDDDKHLQEELEVITDELILKEIKAKEESDPSATNKNFNLDLTNLINLHVTGESFVPLSDRDGSGPSSEIEQVFSDQVTNDGKEWLAPIMSTNSDESRQNSQDNVDALAQEFTSVNLQENANVPIITLSNCCEGCSRTDAPDNTSLAIHLTVPTVQSIDESRPPIIR